jgi:uncharacterized Zn-finger protein
LSSASKQGARRPPLDGEDAVVEDDVTEDEGDDSGKLHNCKTCGKTFTQSGNMNRHQLVHSNDRRFRCSECGKSFTQKAHLKTHSNIHSGRRDHGCTVCEKRFSQLGHLKTHLRIHERARGRHAGTVL